MHPTSELILRNAEAFSSGGILLFNPPRDQLAGFPNIVNPEARFNALNAVIPEAREAGILESISGHSQVPGNWIPDVCYAKSGMTAEGGENAKSGMTDLLTVFTQDFGDHQFFAAAGISSQFGLLPDESLLPAHIILFLPREKDRLEFLLHFIASHMPETGTLWLVGENKAGIKSAEGRLKQRFVQVKKVDGARHCVLYQAQQPKAPEPASGLVSNKEHGKLRERASLATNPTTPPQIPGITTFSIDDYRQEWTLPTSAGELKLQSLPGAFAHGRLDKGTALLLEYLQSPAAQKLKIKGKVIDFGCGVGVIGLLLKLQRPDLTLEMLDSSASALESTRSSMLLNGCEAEVVAADGLDGIKGRYDWIISNPPFHKGVNINMNIARRMMARAPALLGNRGKLLLVCNRHLPYEAWLAESFSSQEKLIENREFKVLLAYGPGRK